MANTIEIVIKANNQTGNVIADVNSGLSKIGSTASGAVSGLGSFSGALGNVLTTAGGFLTARIFENLASGVTSFVSAGFNAVNTAQQMAMSFQSLAVQGLMYDQVTKTMTVATEKSQKELDNEGTRLATLESQRSVLIARLQEQKEKVRQMTTVWKEEGLATKTAQTTQADMERRLAQMNAEISELTSSETTYATVTKTSWQQVMNLAEAQGLAKKQSADLLVFTEKLAAISPFEQEQVQLVTKYGLMAGLSAENTQKFTKSFLDLAAGAGVASGDLGYTAYQFTQLANKANISAIDIRELASRGIDLKRIIGVELGMSVDQFNDKLKKNPDEINKLFDAVQSYADKTFPSVSESFSRSIMGITSTARDLGLGIARRLLTPLVDAVSPYLSDMLSKLTDTIFGTTTFEDAGKRAAEMLMSGLSTVSTLVSAFQRGGLFGMYGMHGVKESGLLAALGLDKSSIEMIKNAMTIVKGIPDQIIGVVSAFQNLGLEGGLSYLESVLSSGWDTYIKPILDGWATKFMRWVQQIYPQIPTILTSVVTNIGTFLSTNWPIISTYLKDWSTKFWDWAKDAAGQAAIALEAIGVSMMAWATSPDAQTSLNNLGQTIGSMLTDYIKLELEGGEGTTQVVVTLVAGIVSAIGSATVAIALAGGQIVAGIVAGVINSLTGGDFQPATISELGKVLTGIGDNAKTIAMYVGKQITSGIQSGWQATKDIVSKVISDSVEGWRGLFTVTHWIDIGTSIIGGVLKGLKDSGHLVLEYLKQLIGADAYQTIMSAIQGGSPAMLFAPAGASVVQGVEKGAMDYSSTFANNLANKMVSIGSGIMSALSRGVDTGSKEFHRALSKSLQSAIDFSSELKRNLVSNRQEIRNIFTAFVAAHKGELATITGGQLKNYIIQYANAFGGNAKFIIDEMIKRGYDFEQLAAQMRNTYSGFMKQLRMEAAGQTIGVAQQFLGLGQTAADRMMSGIQNQIDILQSIVDAEGGEYLGNILSATQAQDMLNQKLEEQAGIQKQINDLQQQQANLQFLQQQVELIKMVQERGLDVSQIFKGITFGLDASLPDMINATSSVVQAMIGQIDSDLQIASPSRVMFNKFKQVGGGMVNGLLATRDRISNAVTPVVDTVVSSGDRALRQTNNYFNQTVNTRADSSSVINDFRVMQMMVGS